MKRAQRIVQRFAKSIKGLLATVAPLAAGAALFKWAQGLEEFNQAMRSSLAIMGKVSDAMRKVMEETALEVAKTTRFMAKEAAEAYFFLASAGLSAAASVKALPLVSKFAQAGMFNLAQATDLLTDAQSALGLSSKNVTANLANMTRVSDVLVKANTLANASVEQFSQALTTKAGAKMKTYNIDLAEGVAVLAAYADQGIKAADAGSAFNIIIRDLTTKAIQNAKAFERANIAVFDAGGSLRNLGTIIADVEKALEGLSDAQRKAALLTLGFTDKSVAFIQTLIGTSEKIAEYEEALKGATGTTMQIADKQLTSFAKSWNFLTGAMTHASKILTPVITLVGALAWVVGKTAEAFASIPEIAKSFFGKDAASTVIRELNATGEAIDSITNATKDMTKAMDAAARATAQLRAERKAFQVGVRDTRAEQLFRRGRQLELELRTPMEIFRNTMNELDVLLKGAGGEAAISLETFARAVHRAEELLPTPRTDAFIKRREAEIEALLETQRGLKTAMTFRQITGAAAVPGLTAQRQKPQAVTNKNDDRRDKALQRIEQKMGAAVAVTGP
jgi:TP901 family phage tail tape measure protein